MHFPIRFLAPLLLSCVAQAQSLKLVQVADGLGTPTDAVSPPGDEERLFVTSANGRVWVLEHGVRRPEPFLDIAPLVFPQQGLLSLAFHPDYADNGRFFITYLDLNYEAWLVEYQVSGNPNLADPASETVLFGPYPQIGNAHNWNCLRFGPDGMLYVATGDGGATHIENPAQDLSSLNGKILRLDVDLPAPYVPADNPFLQVPGARGEIWMYGLRQPWRMSFDPLTGDLFVADVGLHDAEEINFVAAGVQGGQNFGWRCLDGDTCTNFGDCTCSVPDYEPPVHIFDHTEGRCAVIGGAVYRGSKLPDLFGAYLFADHCSGRIWSMRLDQGVVSELVEHTAELSPPGGVMAGLVTSINVDVNGELLILDRDGGRMFRVAEAPLDRYCLAQPNSSGQAARMIVAGSASVSTNEFLLIARRAVAGGFGLFFYGDRRVLQPFGDGTRCVGGLTRRLQPILPVDPAGHAALRYDLTTPPFPGIPIAPGETWNFQFWFRDGQAPSGFNSSDGVTVTFLP